MAQFDGPNKIITLDEPTSSVLSINVQVDLYSQWKQWVRGIVSFNTETNVGNEFITIADHSLYTGQRVVYNSGSILDSPVNGENIGLNAGSEYFVRRINRNTFELYDTKANAQNSDSPLSITGRIDLTASGLGNGETHELIADNSKFPLAFRTVGGDSLTPGVEAGAYFFLQNQNGWRIVSSDDDQTINYSGNLVGENSSLPIINATTNRTVLHLGLQPVTQRVDEILTQTQNSSYAGVVAIDPTSIHSGTSFPVGTRSAPVNNLADAEAISDILGLTTFELRGSITLDRSTEGVSFMGIGSAENDIIDINGFSVDKTIFKNCKITGTMTGVVECIECDLSLVLGVSGIFIRCGLSTDLTLANGGEIIFDSCYSTVPGTSSPICDTNGATSVSFRNYSGGLELTNVVAGSSITVDLDPGTIKILDGKGNTGGVTVIRGLGTKEIGSSIGTTIVDRLFDITEAQLGLASLVGNVDITVDDQTVSILDRNLNNLRDLSVSADGRTRRIL